MRVDLFVLVVFVFTSFMISNNDGALQSKKLTKNIQNGIIKTVGNKNVTTKLRFTKVPVQNTILKTLSKFKIKSTSKSTRSKKLTKITRENKLRKIPGKTTKIKNTIFSKSKFTKVPVQNTILKTLSKVKIKSTIKTTRSQKWTKIIRENILRMIPGKSTKITNKKFSKSKKFMKSFTKDMQKNQWKLKHEITTRANHKATKIKATRHLISKNNIPTKTVNPKLNLTKPASKYIKNNFIEIIQITSRKSKNVLKDNSKDRLMKALEKQYQKFKTSKFTTRRPNSINLISMKKAEHESFENVPQNIGANKPRLKGKYKYDLLKNSSKFTLKLIASKRKTIPTRLNNKSAKVKSTIVKFRDLRSFGPTYSKFKSKNVSGTQKSKNNVKITRSKTGSTSKKPTSRAEHRNLKPRSLEINGAKHKQIKTNKPTKSQIKEPRKTSPKRFKTLVRGSSLITKKSNKFKTSLKTLRTSIKRTTFKKNTIAKKSIVIKKENKNLTNLFKVFIDSQEIHKTLTKKTKMGPAEIPVKTTAKFKSRASSHPRKSITSKKKSTTIATEKSLSEPLYTFSSTADEDLNTTEWSGSPNITFRTTEDHIISTTIDPNSTTFTTFMFNIIDGDNSSLSPISSIKRKTRWIKKVVLEKKDRTQSKGRILAPEYANVEIDLPMTLVNRILSFEGEPVDQFKIIDVPVPLVIKPAAIKNPPFKKVLLDKPIQLTTVAKIRKNRLPLVDYDFLSGTKLNKMVSHDSSRLIMIGTITFLAVMLAFVAALVFCIAFT